MEDKEEEEEEEKSWHRDADDSTQVLQQKGKKTWYKY